MRSGCFGGRVYAQRALSLRTRVIIVTGTSFVSFCCVVLFLTLGIRFDYEVRGKSAAHIEEHGEAPVPVLVAVRDIRPGEQLTLGMFRQELRVLPELGLSGLSSSDSLKGMYAVTFIPKDFLLRNPYLISKVGSPGIQDSIPEGYRAIAIRTDALTLVDGFALPGSYVEVLWIAKVRGKLIAATLVPKAQVLSLERRTDVVPRPGMTISHTATLLCSATDAVRVQLAATTGEIRLVLGDDDELHTSGPVAIDDIYGRPSTQRKTSDVIEIDGKTYHLNTQRQLTQVHGSS